MTVKALEELIRAGASLASGQAVGRAAVGEAANRRSIPPPVTASGRRRRRPAARHGARSTGGVARLSHVAWLPTRCWAVGRWRMGRETPPPLPPPGLVVRLRWGPERETEAGLNPWLGVSAPHLRRQEPLDCDRVCGSWRQS